MNKNIHPTQFLKDKIKTIILNEWDPIGIQDLPEAQDEYGSYIPDIYRLIQLKKTENEIFDYLWGIETGHMGLSGDKGHTQAIAHKLFKLSTPEKSTDFEPVG